MPPVHAINLEQLEPRTLLSGLPVDGGLESPPSTPDTTNLVLNAMSVGPVMTIDGPTNTLLTRPVSYDVHIGTAGLDETADFKINWKVSGPYNWKLTGTGPSIRFTPELLGTFVIEVSATHPDGRALSGQLPVTTNAGSVSVSLKGPSTASEGDLVSLDLDVQSDLEPFVSWAAYLDGVLLTSENGTRIEFYVPDDGPVFVQVYASNGYGGNASATFDIQVENVAPKLVVAPPNNLTEGERLNFTVSTIDVDTVAVTWFAELNGTVFASGTTSEISFIVPDSGELRLFVSADDGDGGIATSDQRLAIANLAPTASFASDGDVTGAGPASVRFSNAVDCAADVAAGFRYSYDFDSDGVFEIVDSTSPSATFQPGHTGAFNVTAMIRDKDGGTTTYQTTVNVVNNAPKVVIDKPVAGTGPQKGEAGTSFKRNHWMDFTFHATNAGPEPTTGFTYRVDWDGDGTFDEVIAGGSSLTLRTRFRDAGTYNVTVQVTDPFGAVRTSTMQIEIFR